MQLLIFILLTAMLLAFFLTNVRTVPRYPEGTSDAAKLLRSELDGELVTPYMVSQGTHVGQRMRIATSITLMEWLLLKLRIKR